MSTCISRLVILAIVISALIVAVSARSAIAFQQGDTSSSYKSGDTEGSNRIGASDRSEGVTAPGAGTEDPTQQCQMSCSTEKSGIGRTLCSLGCGYLAGPVPMIP
jgi:hypothetical protein